VRAHVRCDRRLWDQTPVSLRAKLFFIYPFSIGIIALALAVVISKH